MTTKPTKPKSKKRILRNLAIALVVMVAFVLLFVAAFVFNPFEGTVRDVRDVVPRGVNFYARKVMLAEDFTEFPTPVFWEGLTHAIGYSELASGATGESLRRAGIERAVSELRKTAEQVRAESGGWVDLVRDLIGKEIVVAGYMQDYTRSTPQPLAEPQWCCYMRVSWRIKAALGLAGFGFVQSQIADGGIPVETVGDLLVARPPGASPIYIKRHRDVLMVSNDQHILDQSQRLIDGNRDEEPLGQMSTYTDGAIARIGDWAEDNAVTAPNVVEYVFEPNAFDGFHRFASSWPNPANKDSMNERVLASFLNLKGWRLVTGGIMFQRGALAATGQIVLNAQQHTEFQRSFYSAESKPRADWLDPFLSMVPQSACAAAAMRMPVGDFLHAMFGAMEVAERDLVNEGVRRSTFEGQQLTDVGDLIERLRLAFLPRAGFVFRRNMPDLSRDANGDLNVPVTNRSPMPQVAWIFWLREGSQNKLENLIEMLRNQPGNFYIKKVWHLRVPFAGGALNEPVTEFCNPQIPATGEIAMMVFSNFFVLSNSGPLIKDILRTHYRVDGNRPISSPGDNFDLFERELPNSLNGFLWLKGKNLVPVLDDYMDFASASSELPDPDWLVTVRGEIEEVVRRSQFARYPSKASIPPSVLRGDFEQAVIRAMNERWRKERTNFTAGDRDQMQQLRAMAQLLDAGYIQLELMNNFIRFQTKLLLKID